MAGKSTTKKATTAAEQHAATSRLRRALLTMVGWWTALTARVKGLLARRPHRSFQRTRRRDYVRRLDMPGYWAFTNGVRRTIWQHKRLFAWTVAMYTIFTITLVGMGSQATYTALSQELRDAGTQVFQGEWGELTQASILLLGGVSGVMSQSPTEAQQVYGIILMLLLWLTVVWLLRAIMASRKPKFRDGLYNAGAPIVPTALLALVGLIQLIPAIIAVIGVSALAASGMLVGGIEAMLAWLAAGALATLSLYWLTSTFVALIVVTLPGMRPFQALKIAGDLVIGRRLRILFRLLWLGLTIAVIWVVVMVPLILLDIWVKGMIPAIEWLPVVPIALVAVSSLSVTIAATYIYLLYRKIVDDESAPA